MIVKDFIARRGVGRAVGWTVRGDERDASLSRVDGRMIISQVNFFKEEFSKKGHVFRSNA